MKRVNPYEYSIRNTPLCLLCEMYLGKKESVYIWRRKDESFPNRNKSTIRQHMDRLSFIHIRCWDFSTSARKNHVFDDLNLRCFVSKRRGLGDLIS